MEVTDPSVIVQFDLLDQPNTSILVWTTTPWTLPSNVAVCVHPELEYLKVRQRGLDQQWLVGKDRFNWVCSCLKKTTDDFEVLGSVKGADLVGYKYKPLFDYFKDKVDTSKAWRIVADAYV